MAIGHLPDHKIELYVVKKNSKPMLEQFILLS